MTNKKEAVKGIFGGGNSMCQRHRVMQQDDICGEGGMVVLCVGVMAT